MAEDFLMNSTNNRDINEFLVKTFHHLYRGGQICFLFYRYSMLTNHPEQVSDEGVSIRKWQPEEAYQRVIWYTLHCVGEKNLQADRCSNYWH